MIRSLAWTVTCLLVVLVGSIRASGRGEIEVRAQATQPAPAPLAPAAADSYGPVTATDTLWSLAERLRPDETVSMQRMMLALLKANPDAFTIQNVEALQEGAVLRVPIRAEIGPDARSEALVTVRRQSAEWDAYRGSAVGHVSPTPAPAEPMPEAASPPPARPAVTEAAMLDAVPPAAVAPPPPVSIPDSLPAAVPVSPMLIIGPAGVVLVFAGAVALVRRRRAAREVGGDVAPAPGVEEPGSLVEHDEATEMPAAGSDDAVVVRAAVLDGDRLDAVPENAPSDRDPDVRRPDDGDDANLHDGGEPAPTDDDAVDPSVAAARYRSVDGSAGPTSEAVRRARLAWSNEDHDRTRPPNGRPPEPTRTTKVGRNAPCPCGSGKKYKKCCGATVH